MTLDLDDPDLFRQLLTEAPAPALPTRDVAGLALRDGRRRVRRRRIAGVALGTSLSCLTALAAPRAIDALRGRGSSDAAGELWADPSTKAGAVIARVDHETRVGVGPLSTVTVTDDGVTIAEIKDWRVNWHLAESRLDPALDASVRGTTTIDPRQDRCLTATVVGHDLVIRSGGGGRAEQVVGTVPLSQPLTGVVVHLADGEGWVALAVSGTAVTEETLHQVHLGEADVWATLDDAALPSAGEVVASTQDGRLGVASGDLKYRLAALRLAEGGEKSNPFDEVAVDVSHFVTDEATRADDVPKGSVVRTVAKTVLLEER